MSFLRALSFSLSLKRFTGFNIKTISCPLVNRFHSCSNLHGSCTNDIGLHSTTVDGNTEKSVKKNTLRRRKRRGGLNLHNVTVSGENHSRDESQFLKSLKEKQTSENTPGEENLIETSFGLMRFDLQNSPTYTPNKSESNTIRHSSHQNAKSESNTIRHSMPKNSLKVVNHNKEKVKDTDSVTARNSAKCHSNLNEQEYLGQQAHGTDSVERKLDRIDKPNILFNCDETCDKPNTISESDVLKDDSINFFDHVYFDSSIFTASSSQNTENNSKSNLLHDSNLRGITQDHFEEDQARIGAMVGKSVLEDNAQVFLDCNEGSKNMSISQPSFLQDDDLNFIDKDYFGNYTSNAFSHEQSSYKLTFENSSSDSGLTREPYVTTTVSENVVDCVPMNDLVNLEENYIGNNTSVMSVSSNSAEDKWNEFEDEFFGDCALAQPAKCSKRVNKDSYQDKLINNGQNLQQSIEQKSKAQTKEQFISEPNNQSSRTDTNSQRDLGESHTSIKEMKNTNKVKKLKTEKKATTDTVITNSEKNENLDKGKSQTAYDVIQEMRKKPKIESKKAVDILTEKQIAYNPWATKWEGKVDSHGFKNLNDQVLDFTHWTDEDMLIFLKKSIIYEDDNIVAINKPYGLATHGGPGIHQNVGRHLSGLTQKVNPKLDKLHIVHRLDKETTGVMLLAKNSKVAATLVSAFKQRQFVKKYWVITKGVPNPEEGVIDIPMAEGIVGEKRRMKLQPVYPEEMKLLHKASKAKSTSKTMEAITNFRVLCSHQSAALVECQPESGVKHQIRCHLAFGMNTLILGDHKYSNLTKMAPQKLPPDMLQGLGIRQAKVRTVPMHLHAKTVILPEFKDGKNLFVEAPVPHFFRQNMRWLKLKLKKNK